MKGTELAAKREKCGLTQEQLAEYLGIGRTSVWRMETGNEPVSRAVEVSSQTLEIGGATFEEWVKSLTTKKRIMLWRRQQKYKIQEAV